MILFTSINTPCIILVHSLQKKSFEFQHYKFYFNFNDRLFWNSKYKNPIMDYCIKKFSKRNALFIYYQFQLGIPIANDKPEQENWNHRLESKMKHIVKYLKITLKRNQQKFCDNPLGTKAIFNPKLWCKYEVMLTLDITIADKIGIADIHS